MLHSVLYGVLLRAPETFARVMDRSRDRVDSVVFFVRDKLRLEVRPYYIRLRDNME